MELESIVLREESQTQKVKVECFLSYVEATAKETDIYKIHRRKCCDLGLCMIS